MGFHSTHTPIIEILRARSCSLFFAGKDVAFHGKLLFSCVRCSSFPWNYFFITSGFSFLGLKINFRLLFLLLLLFARRGIQLRRSNTHFPNQVRGLFKFLIEWNNRDLWPKKGPLLDSGLDSILVSLSFRTYSKSVWASYISYLEVLNHRTRVYCLCWTQTRPR